MIWWSCSPAIVHRLESIPEPPSSCDSYFERQTQAKLAIIQEQYVQACTDTLKLIDHFWNYPKGTIWVPDDATDIQLRLWITANSSPARHRGCGAAGSALRSKFQWSTLTEHVCSFTCAWIHCLSTAGKERVSRPFGVAIYSTNLNNLVPFRLTTLTLAEAPTVRYTFSCFQGIIRTIHSSFYPHCCRKRSNSNNDWCFAFGVPKALISGRPTHFRNEDFRIVLKDLRVPQHIRLTYSSWSNGTVEQLKRKLLFMLRAVLSKFHMNNKEWPDLISKVLSVQNNPPSPQCGNICPITAFMGRDQIPPIRTLLRSTTVTPVTVPEELLERSLNF